MKVKPISLYHQFVVLSIALALSILFGSRANAAVTVTGDNRPADPATWNAGVHVYIGENAPGSLTIDDGSTVDVGRLFPGNEAAGVGTILVTGEGSTLTINSYASLGRFGSAMVTVEDKGTINCIGTMYIGSDSSNVTGISTVTITNATFYSAGQFEVGSGTNAAAATVGEGALLTVDGTFIVRDVGATFSLLSGGTLILNSTVWADLTVPDGAILKGVGRYDASYSTVIEAGGQTQYTGGPLFTAGGAGYTISGPDNTTLANRNYNVQPGGTIQRNNSWILTAGAATSSFKPSGPLTLGLNDDFSTLNACTGVDSVSFGPSTSGMININHEATITAFDGASLSRMIIGAGGKINCSTGMDMRNSPNITINVLDADFAAGRTIVDLGADTWTVDPLKVTLNVIGAPTGSGTVIIAKSTGAKAMTTDGTNAIEQVDLDRWIEGLPGWYTIGYDGTNLLLNLSYDPPTPGDSNEEIIDRQVSGGFIVLPEGATTEDVIASLTATTGGSITSFNAAKTLNAKVSSRINNLANLANWTSSDLITGNNDTFRGKCSRETASLWFESVGTWANQDAVDAMTLGYNASLLGVQVGADRLFGSKFIGGVSFAGAVANTRSDGQKMTTDLFDVQLYGAWRAFRKLRCVGAIGYQYMDYTGEFLGANSTHVGNMFKMAAGLEYDIRLGRMLLTPIYSWEYYKTDEDAYETGQFAVDGNTTQAIYQRCGMRVGVVCHPRIKIDLHSSWLRNFGDENIIFSATSGGVPFQLTGAPLHYDLGEVGLDTTIALSRHLDLTLGYLGVYANGFNTQSVNGLLRWSF